MNLVDEQALVEQAKHDRQAFAKLYDLYYPKISNYLLRRCGDVAIAQDLTSDVFMKALRALPGFQWRGVPFSSWLYRIAGNELKDYYRRHRHQPFSLDELYEDHQIEIAGNIDLERSLVEAQMEADRYRDFCLVRDLLQQLPLKYQEVLALRYFEKKPLKDIADITGRNLNTVKSLLSRGTKQLRQAFLETKARTGLQLSPLSDVIKAEE